MSRATKDVMDALHKALAEQLTDILQNGELAIDKETGEATRKTPQASTLNVIRQFLKDNGVEVAPGTSPDINRLAESARNLPFPTRADEYGFPIN